jgi:hypothetical protein
MSLEMSSATAANLAYAEPAATLKHVVPDPPTPLDTSEATGTSITTGIQLAVQLAAETITQLQLQADAGDDAAIAELERRAIQGQPESAASNAPAAAPASHGTASPQEPGKGTQIDETG